MSMKKDMLEKVYRFPDRAKLGGEIVTNGVPVHEVVDHDLEGVDDTEWF